jgi:hypothetical protein
MADVPTNEKLYAMVVFQAKARYRIYPSPGASAWVHRRYLELGGRFEDEVDKHRREDAIEKAKERIAAKRAGRDHDENDHHKKHEDKK